MKQIVIRLGTMYNEQIFCRFSGEQFGLPEDFCIPLSAAVVELAGLDMRTTPLDRMTCIYDTVEQVGVHIRESMLEAHADSEDINSETFEITDELFEDLKLCWIAIIICTSDFLSKNLFDDVSQLFCFPWSSKHKSKSRPLFHSSLNFQVDHYRYALCFIQFQKILHIRTNGKWFSYLQLWLFRQDLSIWLPHWTMQIFLLGQCQKTWCKWPLFSKMFPWFCKT